MKTKTALFDLDDTLAGYSESLMRSLKILQKPNDPPITSLNYLKADPIHRQRMEIIKNEMEFWFHLPPLRNGFNILFAAIDVGYSINIVSKGPIHYPIAWAGKFEWCQKHLGDLKYDVTITTNKSPVNGDILVDDDVDIVKNWLYYHPLGVAIMPEQPQNQGFTGKNIIKYTGNEDLKEIFKNISE